MGRVIEMEDKNKLPERKRNRLRNYDYSKPGAYFITICTENRRKILSRIVGADVPPTRQHEEVSQFVSTFKRFCNKEYGGTFGNAPSTTTSSATAATTRKFPNTFTKTPPNGRMIAFIQRNREHTKNRRNICGDTSQSVSV